jgi:hypothetical protein
MGAVLILGFLEGREAVVGFTVFVAAVVTDKDMLPG